MNKTHLPNKKPSLSIIILTYNEEIHIGRAIDAARKVSDHIFVIDSGSSDATASIARSKGATVLFNRFINYSMQFQWALDNAPIHTDWVMRLDADEVIEDDLSQEIINQIPTLQHDVVGINVKRKHIFMNRWIKHGGRFPLILLRIWRNGYGKIEDRWMDEHIVTWGGRTITFNGGFSDWNLNDLTYFTEKHNRYATREALDVLNQKLMLFPTDQLLNTRNTSLQASLKRWIKEHLYNHIPFTVSTTLYFLWRYIFQLGFLDGRTGLIYHFLQGYWYRFLVGAKLMELEQKISHIHEKSEILEELTRLTGHNLIAIAQEKKSK